MRDFLLGHSKIIVQDDSGIPYHYFDPAKWQIRYCGTYVGPIDLFKQYPQPDLAKDYSLVPPAPLHFSFGYQWQPSRASLIIATRTPQEVLPQQNPVAQSDRFLFA